MKRTCHALAAVFLCLALAAPAGAGSEEYKGTAKGTNSKSYTVEVAAGQKLAVELKAKSSAVHFNVIPPPASLGDNPAPIYLGESGGRSFAQRLDKPGRYRIDVFLEKADAERGEQASFTLSVSTEP
ncbi:MAG TPA: hypothetical protein VMR86_19640 [Myxococcota bacterium]|nr:hypothetical protein [Myxococcota bacterium]